MVTRADIARQALDLSKATFDNTYLSLAALQQVAEDALVAAVAGTSWVPTEVEGIVRACVGFGQRTRGDLKDTVDRCHGLLHDLIDRTLAGATDSAAGQPRDREPAAVH